MVPADLVLPDRFDLLMEDLRQPVLVVWRRPSYVGVSFEPTLQSDSGA